MTTGHPDIFGFYGENQTVLSREQVEDFLKQSFPTFEDQECLVKHYLGKEHADTYQFAIAKSLGDYVLTCPTVYFATVSAQSGANVYYYDFRHKSSFIPWADWVKPTHFDEVQFVFGGPFKYPTLFSVEERTLSKMMIEHWTNFVKYG
ncbi:Acetylcholinesterase-1 [Araneus ventricosus]|uniref:Acetylcholinesterase-1 n=1 Tax=Araneus ventricosus TaxID=182803 RepID=A0A4Y2T4D1_ARAVE|nr:Acetylcholinesterase-1 [Araneus ventricosus]GBN94280.1 Acetylcholinesterase-1 [Araneus ventricosus]GBN94284.1 Acetylcholinesterase-1 [Araneus ventricosus]GBN94289.1 Acetylcholinesterase-1 [Araneus ventricosus]